MNEDLEKRMREALSLAAKTIEDLTDDIVNECVCDDSDVVEERGVANRCRALAKEGVK